MVSIADVMSISGMAGTGESRAAAMAESRAAAQAADFERFRELLAAAMADTEAALKERSAQIRQAAEAFESYFLQIMFREMRRTSFDEGGLFPRSNAERIFTDMLDEEIAKSAAGGRGMGLADMIYRQMSGDF